FFVALREWTRLESRGAAGRRRGGMLQHGPERGPREERNAAYERRDESRMYDRKGRRCAHDYEDGARRARCGAQDRRRHVSAICQRNEGRMPDVEGAQGQCRHYGQCDTRVVTLTSCGLIP